MIYSKIKDFCSVRNLGNCYKNGSQPTPRVKFLMELLKKESIEYELDIFGDERPSMPKRRRSYNMTGNFRRYINFLDFDDFGDFDEGEDEEPIKNNFFNIILRGSSDKMVVAHHDIQNPNIDNANDNSASVINAIALKKMRPELNVVLLDGEEMGGIGSTRLSKQIKKGDFGKIQWVLNLELTGKGGKYFFIGNYPGPLFDKIKGLFDCPVVRTPYNDSVTIRTYGIDSCVINPLPPSPDNKKTEVLFNDGTYLDYSYLYHCHNAKDSLSSISVDDMKEFVEEVLIKIID